jgi:N-acetylneuraminic acid mutarotase
MAKRQVNLVVLVLFILLTAVLASDFLASAAYAAGPKIWAYSGSLTTPRDSHTATLLANGQVLVAGGSWDGGPLDSSELFDPAKGTWTATQGSLTTPRDSHTATLLLDNRVLVAGGSGGLLNSTEIYDPATDSWTPTKGALNTARFGHTATRLPDGKVLVAGGYNSSGYLNSAEIYDPAGDSWTAKAPLKTARHYHTATLLAGGRVLVAGGRAPGTGGPGTGVYLNTSELYNPGADSWSFTQGALNTRRQLHTATLLANGQVLVAGGENKNTGVVLTINSAELYDPGTGQWTPTSSLNSAREFHTATPLLDGRVLVTGGTDGTSSLNSAELYQTRNVGAPLLLLLGD